MSIYFTDGKKEYFYLKKKEYFYLKKKLHPNRRVKVS